eukprot:4775121-Prymnesium_polylepis.1
MKTDHDSRRDGPLASHAVCCGSPPRWAVDPRSRWDHLECTSLIEAWGVAKIFHQIAVLPGAIWRSHTFPYYL